MSDTPKGKVSAWIPAPSAPARNPLLPLSQVLVSTHEAMSARGNAPVSHDAWVQMVGTRIGSRTRVGSLHGGVLVIKVASAAWSTELSFLRADILKHLQARGLPVRDLRFRVEGDKSAHSPRRAQPQAAAGPGKPQDLPPELLARLAQVSDPNLRSAIAEAARASLCAAPQPAGHWSRARGTKGR